MSLRCSGFTGTFTLSGVGSGTGVEPSAGVTSFTRVGVTKRPPFAITEIMRQSCMGVVRLKLWPMATDRVSPSCQRTPKRRFFHWEVGTSPPDSWGRGTPESTPRPNALAYLASRSTPSFSPTL